MHFAGQAMCATESLAADFLSLVAEISAGASRYNIQQYKFQRYLI